MPQLLAPFVLFLALLLALNMFMRASPGNVATGLRWLSAGTFVIFGLASLTRGLLPLALAFFAAAALAAGGARRFSDWMAGQRRTAGQSSRVRTKVLSMNLDHETGNLDGDVTSGKHTGRQLSELTLNELMEVRADCLEAGDQSARLLDAYLDRTHENWRDGGHDSAAGQGGSGGAMTSAEAYGILGLEPGATKKEINAAHRSLMKKFHPDHGGSEYLAQKINEARDLLLQGL